MFERDVHVGTLYLDAKELPPLLVVVVPGSRSTSVNAFLMADLCPRNRFFFRAHIVTRLSFCWPLTPVAVVVCCRFLAFSLLCCSPPFPAMLAPRLPPIKRLPLHTMDAYETGFLFVLVQALVCSTFNCFVAVISRLSIGSSSFHLDFWSYALYGLLSFTRNLLLLAT